MLYLKTVIVNIPKSDILNKTRTTIWNKINARYETLNLEKRNIDDFFNYSKLTSEDKELFDKTAISRAKFFKIVLKTLARIINNTVMFRQAIMCHGFMLIAE